MISEIKVSVKHKVKRVSPVPYGELLAQPRVQPRVKPNLLPVDKRSDRVEFFKFFKIFFVSCARNNYSPIVYTL